jgi:hypothetical protein
MLIPAMLWAALVVVATMAVFVLDSVARGILVDEASVVAMLIVVEPMSIFMSMAAFVGGGSER